MDFNKVKTGIVTAGELAIGYSVDKVLSKLTNKEERNIFGKVAITAASFVIGNYITHKVMDKFIETTVDPVIENAEEIRQKMEAEKKVAKKAEKKTAKKAEEAKKAEKAKDDEDIGQVQVEVVKGDGECIGVFPVSEGSDTDGDIPKKEN